MIHELVRVIKSLFYFLFFIFFLFYFLAPEQGLDRKKEAWKTKWKTGFTEMKDWIYRLTKSDLVTELETLGIDADDLRRRRSHYVDQHSDEFCAAARPWSAPRESYESNAEMGTALWRKIPLVVPESTSYDASTGIPTS